MANPKNEEFLELTNKYLDNTASKDEVALIEAYYDLFSTEPDVLERIAELGLDALQKKLKGRISSRIKEMEVQGIDFPKTVIHRLWYRVAGVAVILICLGTALYFYANRTPKPSAMLITAANDIAPGGNKATLTLADGNNVSLPDVADGKVATEEGVTITKTSQGLLYKVSNQPKTDSEVKFNTLSTPRGGQFQIQLPDGTKVWLNAASAIKFPTTFFGLTERKIELKGEAYFEVTKRGIPFIVQTERQRVEVLGTHFNVNAYRDGGAVKTTLLEGLVRIVVPDMVKSEAYILKPDQQAILTDRGIHISQVDAEQAIAWKAGIFMFDGEHLDVIMQKIARWYDIDVSFENEELKDKVFSGSFSRFTNVSSALQKIELTRAARFMVKGRKITVCKY